MIFFSPLGLKFQAEMCPRGIVKEVARNGRRRIGI